VKHRFNRSIARYWSASVRKKASSKGRLRTGLFCLEKHQIPQSFESFAILLTWYRDTAAGVHLWLFGAVAAWRYD
jgi:hypothetical protein